MRALTATPLVLVALLGAPALSISQDPPVATVEEPETEIAFPVELVVHVDEEERETVHQLVATGVREKTIFAVDVYAFGFYLDAAAGVVAGRFGH